MNLPKNNDNGEKQRAFYYSLFFLIGAFLMIVGGFAILFMVKIENSYFAPIETLTILMLAYGLIAIGVLQIPGLYLNFNKFNNHPYIQCPKFHLKDDVFFSLISVSWLFALYIGQATTNMEAIKPNFLPIINIISVGLPIIFLVRISINHIQLPPVRRMWTLFGASLLISPFLAFLLEASVLIIFIVTIFLLANFIPFLKEQLNTVISIIKFQVSSYDEIMPAVANLLFSPIITILMFCLFSLIIPIIEEFMKIVLLLAFRRKGYSPIDGFILGTLCGAAFAFSENIGFSSAGSTDWATNIVIRATADLPHIFNSGILGWALFSAWEKKQPWNLIKNFTLVVLIHGSWNAISLGLMMNNFSPFISEIPLYAQSPYPWILVWLVLVIFIFLGMLFNNSKARNFQKLTFEKNQQLQFSELEDVETSL